MFWGLIMEPQRRYTQEVNKSFHISMATLDLESSSDGYAQVICTFNGKNYLLCTLQKPGLIQCALDLEFAAGTQVSFAANGKSHIHLTGYLTDYDDEEGLTLEDFLGTEEQEDVSEEDDSGEDENLSEEAEDEEEVEEPIIEEEIVSKKQQRKLKKEKNKEQQESNQSPQKTKQTLKGGVIVEDLVEGSGPPAKNGKFITVYYEGKLQKNNKIFDKTEKGPGFKFRLGTGEVIKGWDIGIVGMKAGGKRKIICPPQVAYGSKGSPPAIPPNSTLVFTVTLNKLK
uniref:peptidylprolyl isomerase n=1 Tax=Dendroctonus ponderosae TaxID=77166 RepID=J3JV94_DENPD|nr:unknown [Dendroctonus ponderosae]